MKRFLSIAAAAFIMAGFVHAQAVVSRNVKIGSKGVTEIAQAPAVAPPEFAVAAAQPDAKAQPGDPKAGKANGQVAPAVGQPPAPADPQLQIRDAVNDGMKELAEAIRSLNPSYAIAPVVGNSAMSGGSYYIRSGAMPLRNGSPCGQATWLALPAPVYLGWGHSQYPWWLYTGTVRVDVPPAAPIRLVAGEDANAREVSALREEVRRLREMIEKLNARIK